MDSHVLHAINAASSIASDSNNIGSAADWTAYSSILGLVLLAVFVVIIRPLIQERREWVQAYKDQADKYDHRQAETNQVLRENAAAIQAMAAALDKMADRHRQYDEPR